MSRPDPVTARRMRQKTDILERLAKGPRLGQPSDSKLILATVQEAVLTDCVFALRSDPPGQEDQLLRLMKSNWPQLEAAYGGSCAPYLTRDRLQSLLLSWGVASTVVTEMRRTMATPDLVGDYAIALTAPAKARSA